MNGVLVTLSVLLVLYFVLVSVMTGNASQVYAHSKMNVTFTYLATPWSRVRLEKLTGNKCLLYTNICTNK